MSFKQSFLNKTNLLFSIFFLIVTLSHAQKIKVIDKSTNEPISEVSIYNKSKNKHQISTIDGVLDISDFSKNEMIFFSHLIYENRAALKNNIKKTIYLEQSENNVEEIFISANKTAVKRSRIAQQLAVITKAAITKLAPQTSADMLANIPGIKVQKSQFGGGSPVLRGMEANRILLVVDGVRMNNAIYRSGHLQNAISVSPNQLEKTEVVFGPSSVMYGSDALGGVIHYFTKKPKTSKTLKVIPNFLTRLSTVNDEFTGNVSVEVQSKKIGSYTSVSFSEFGDLKMGEKRNHGFDSWGLQSVYSNNTNNHYTPNAVINSNPETQKNVAFKQMDILQKIFIPLSEKTDLNINFQFSESSKNERFDRLTEYSNGELKFAEWYYGPQKRMLLSTQLALNPNKKWLKNGTITLAYQDISESRIQRKFNSLDRSYRKENVDLFSFNADFNIPISKNRVLSYGAEAAYNDVGSNAYGKTIQVNVNEITGFSNDFTVQSRYPDGTSSYLSSAIYTSYRQDISKKQTLNTGVRLTNTQLKAQWIDNTFISLPSMNISIANTALTATLGYVYKPTINWQINAVASSGFRSPNLDDIGKIREKNGLVTVPNIDLKPEYAYNGEIGFIKYFNNKKLHIGFTTYYTLLNNYITRDVFSLNGIDTIEYDGEILPTIANVNKDNAYIFGSTFTFKGKLNKKLYSSASLTYTKGEAYDTGNPLSSIPPLFGSAKLGYKKGKFDTSLGFRFNGKKKIEDYNLIEGIDNVEQTPYISKTETYYGNPAWKTVQFSTSYQLHKNVNFIFNIDNILDEHYKEFASSISAAGRNFSFTLVSNF